MQALILEEFDRFYLCDSKFGYKECFLKKDVTTVEEDGKKYVKYRHLYDSLRHENMNKARTNINKQFNNYNFKKVS